MDKKLKFGVVGLGARGSGLLNTLMRVEKAEIVAVCDTYEDRVDKAIERIREERNVTAAGYTDYTKMLEDESVEAVLIVSMLDTTLPKYYSREFTVRGTKGLCMQETNMILLEEKDDMHEFWEPASTIEKHLNNAKDYADYLPGLWKNITQEEQEAGHGGMDYLMLKTFVDAVLSGKEMPIDVYDMATWSSIVALTDQSIALGGAPVVVPDFTRGKWIKRPRKDVTELAINNLELAKE